MFTNVPPLPQAPGTAPTLPLSPTVRAAYQDLYDQYETAIRGTTDAIAIETLMDAKGDVEDVLDKDDMYAINQNTALFDALKGQIDETNKSLETLKGQIEAIAGHIATAGAIVSAIDKVLGLFGV